MTSTQDPSSQQQPSDRPTDQSPDRAAPDPLRNLHRMSRTAGLGEAGYVAVNIPAVAALFFGIGSALVVFDAIFLVMPLTAVVLAIVALRQIKHSNGTQTGRGLAWVGLGVALLFTVILGSRSLIESIRHRQDEDAIVATIGSLGESVSTRKYDSGYAQMSDRFRKRVPLTDFAAKFEENQNIAGYDNTVKAMDWSGRAIFDVDNRTNEPLARTILRVIFKTGHDRESRLEVVLRKTDGQWKIDEMPTLFPPPVQIKSMPRPKAAQ